VEGLFNKFLMEVILVKISVIQMDIFYGEPNKNRVKAELLIEDAVKREPDVIILPELWTTGYDLVRIEQLAETDDGETITLMKSLAKKHSVTIIGGSIAYKQEGKIYNTMLIISKQGLIISSYSKVHLFRLMNEDKYLTAGKKENLFNLEGFSCAGVICYDIRFPEWIRLHSLKGASVLFVSAQWPKIRKEHWRALLISRAIENQSFVVACNRVGKDPNNEFAGMSFIISPEGEVIKEGSNDKEEILEATLDLSLVGEVRKHIPVMDDRRKDLYKLKGE
jgi:omega-amidase